MRHKIWLKTMIIEQQKNALQKYVGTLWNRNEVTHREKNMYAKIEYAANYKHVMTYYFGFLLNHF